MVRNSAALRLASWIGKQGRGSVILRFGGERLVLHVDEGQITAVEGSDGEMLAAALGLPPEGEWFAEAREAVRQGLVTAEEAAAVLKRALTTQLRAFFAHPDAELEVFPGEPRTSGGFVISYPHVAYEMVLRGGDDTLVSVFLPDPSAVLRRLPAFSRRLGELSLPDEALAILAKVNEARSAEAIAEPSPHGRALVLRLLAASVAAGLLEASPSPAQEPELEVEEDVEMVRPRRRRGWLVAGILAVLAALGVGGYTLWRMAPSAPTASGPWSIAVGGACQPVELEQLYRLQAKNREALRVVPFGESSGTCYRLIWGRFPSQEAAERAMSSVPAGLVQRGFVPHTVFVGNNTP